MKNKKKNASRRVQIKVIGVGGAGGNAVSRMVERNIRGVEFISINTDAQDLDFSLARKKIYIGKNLTKGLGTGMNPELGRQAAEENKQDILDAVKGADLIFITAGLGGGTGSGASPVVAELAKETGALTIAVVTKPFTFEGAQRNKIAQDAFVKIKEKVDATITIPNDRIFSVIQKDTPLIKAFGAIDDVLINAVQGITDIVSSPGLVNVDFADVKTIMQGTGTAIVGLGISSGQDRAMKAISQAAQSPLLETSIDGARGILLCLASNRDLKMAEVNDAAKVVAEAIDPSSKIIFGAYNDKRLKSGKLKITLIATGFNGISSNGSSTLFKFASEPSYRLTDSFKNDETKEELAGGSVKQAKEKQEKEEVWDIPTFLRKRKR
ncbi:cell division protein FtsZ [Candidatus Wolfebacteria bacterium RIFCSPLOWO2_01_FULL_45_19]|uniref:Cell division protein FtsZ n=1 Tax=Candidatus Wolfebacteria bacterium RIFCSPLOWO2_01_FULL_45_19 TaxID=1802557 RepID=A0A1F8DPW0_9BACT|nr:MAG: cell division protein FtsZ [Candidatus Wolfebacteria bacterium RIFCSPLOWO2_01_FULL_45_19]